MNALYRVIGITKQAFHKRMNNYLRSQDEHYQLLPMINEIRSDHPRLSARQMYFMINPKCMGRDKFETFCFENGFKIPRKKSFYRTTNSLGVSRFPNLISDFELTAINQVWVSDITYYRIGEQFYFLTFIMDLYSRMIVGYSVSRTLMTEDTTVPALKMALRYRKISSGLIFHSDGGGQFYCKLFLEITSKFKIKNSMGVNAYENPNAERINGTMKNDYIELYHPTNYDDLRLKSKKAVGNYNKRPHSSLRRLSPIDFERMNVEMCTTSP
jgi:putative transposase